MIELSFNVVLGCLVLLLIPLTIVSIFGIIELIKIISKM